LRANAPTSAVISKAAAQEGGFDVVIVEAKVDQMSIASHKIVAALRSTAGHNFVICRDPWFLRPRAADGTPRPSDVFSRCSHFLIPNDRMFAR
jgi:hypothetical protein